MNKEQIIRMAREAGAHELMRIDGEQDSVICLTGNNAVIRFAAAIRAATKDEDAKICDRIDEDEWDYSNADLCASAIRASK